MLDWRLGVRASVVSGAERRTIVMCAVAMTAAMAVAAAEMLVRMCVIFFVPENKRKKELRKTKMPAQIIQIDYSTINRCSKNINSKMISSNDEAEIVVWVLSFAEYKELC